MATILYLALMAVGAILFVGIINRVKAVWGGRRGVPLWQLGYDLARLLRKGEVISTTTSIIFRVAPSVSLGAIITAALLVPLPGSHALLAFRGDFVLFAYLLAFSRFVLVAAALDTGSSFEGMGASREVTFATIIEPAFFILMGTLALASGKTSFTGIFNALAGSSTYTLVVRLLCAVALFIMLLTEGSRVPVDDPNTHLELTMIHEVMILDTSGPDLAFMHFGHALKMVTIGALGANVVAIGVFSTLVEPPWAHALLGGLLLAVVLATTAAAVGVVESLFARARLAHLPQMMFVMTALSLTAFGIVSFFAHGGY